MKYRPVALRFLLGRRTDGAQEPHSDVADGGGESHGGEERAAGCPHPPPEKRCLRPKEEEEESSNSGLFSDSSPKGMVGWMIEGRRSQPLHKSSLGFNAEHEAAAADGNKPSSWWG